VAIGDTPVRKMTWDVARLNKARCEVCKGPFGLIRHRLAHKQFCSKQCLEWYQAERMQRASSLKQWIDVSRRH